MNQEKLSKLGTQVRIGGKGSARRKKKVVHRTATTDDKKLQSSLKKLPVNTIPGIEEVNMIKDDGTLLHFNNPKVQASLAAKTFAITGHAENKQVTEMLPGILNQLGAEAISNLRRLAEKMPARDLPLGKKAVVQYALLTRNIAIMATDTYTITENVTHLRLLERCLHTTFDLHIRNRMKLRCRPDAKENDMEDGDDDVPELLEDFDTASKEETVEA